METNSRFGELVLSELDLLLVVLLFDFQLKMYKYLVSYKKIKTDLHFLAPFFFSYFEQLSHLVLEFKIHIKMQKI